MYAPFLTEFDSTVYLSTAHPWPLSTIVTREYKQVQVQYCIYGSSLPKLLQQLFWYCNEKKVVFFAFRALCSRELETCFLFVNMSREQLGDHADNLQKFICFTSVKQNLLLLCICSILYVQQEANTVDYLFNVYETCMLVGTVLSEALFYSTWKPFCNWSDMYDYACRWYTVLPSSSEILQIFLS